MNNPVNCFDYTGLTTVANKQTDDPFFQFLSLWRESGGSTGAGSAMRTISTVAVTVVTVSAASAVAKKATEELTERDHSVYYLVDIAGRVQYVGRTKNVIKRKAAHAANPARAGLKMEVVASGLTLLEARALEQAGMAYHHTINTADKMNNQINGIAPNHWAAFRELALGFLKYGSNQMTNEILYWAET